MRAIGERGRIAKTLSYWLTLMTKPIADASWSSSTARESRHRLARAVFHGQRGALREHVGLEVRPEDVERIWPPGFQHSNMLGRYSSDLPEQLTHGQLRSLRDASEPF